MEVKIESVVTRKYRLELTEEEASFILALVGTVSVNSCESSREIALNTSLLLASVIPDGRRSAFRRIAGSPSIMIEKCE